MPTQYIRFILKKSLRFVARRNERRDEIDDSFSFQTILIINHLLIVMKEGCEICMKKRVCVLITKYNTWTILVISWMSMTPFPSTSYIRKAHFSFSSGVPLDVTSIANKNSCNEQNWTLLLLSVHRCNWKKRKIGFYIFHELSKIYWNVKWSIRSILTERIVSNKIERSCFSVFIVAIEKK